MTLRALPKVDRVVDAPGLAAVRAQLGDRTLTALAREAVGRWRAKVKDGAVPPSFDEVVADVGRGAAERLRVRARRVINATGVVLHTNLGRAPLPAAALERLVNVAAGYQNLEMDLEIGERSRRGAAVEAALAELVGAESALVVNNNAAAVMLVLSHLAAGREVIVSRGELVEIGGGFRVPDVLARSGARLVEVGTTNRTRVADYAAAIGPNTACLLSVHTSNFEISGFTERPALGQLAELGRTHSLPLVVDLGGGLTRRAAERLGAAADTSGEPTIEACLAAGASLVCFSLDKLFGGPQGGAIVGGAARVGALRKDPMARALRLDKLGFTVLEVVVDAHARGALDELPVHAMLGAPVQALEGRIGRWVDALAAHRDKFEVVESTCAVGGGTLAKLASRALAIRVASPDGLARALRDGEPPLVARILDGRVLVDARTVFPHEDTLLVDALGAALEARS